MLEFLFPKVCGICGEKINERYTCTKCLNILEYYQGMEYSSPLSQTYFDELICLYPYKGVLKSRMLELKFHNKRYLAKTFGDLMARKLEEKHVKADLILAVPISKKRMFERGFNQSEYIAKIIANFNHLPFENRVLIKSVNNSKQSLVGLKERMQNVKNVYEVKNNQWIKEKTVILVDDIYTTGATMNECAKILKKNGAKKVIAFSALYSEKQRLM